MQVVASFIMVAGAIQISHVAIWMYSSETKLNNCWRAMWAQTLSKKLLIIILVFMGLAAMGPETSADGLDYHLGVAIAILNNGGMPVAPEWFMSRLAGNGELLNAVGLSVGAEQFGSLLQYVSLLGIVGVILFARRINGKFDSYFENGASDLIALAVVSSPVLLFLVTSSKPQMWPIALTTFAFALVVHPSRHSLSRSNALIGFTLVCLLVMTASQAKFSFLLGGGVVGLLAFILMAKQRYFLASVGITLLAATLIMAPPVLWKAALFNASWIDALIKPWPGQLPGTDRMDFAVRHLMNSDSTLPFPLSIFFPTSIGSFTTLLGLGGLAFIYIRPERNLWIWSGICAVLVVVAGNVLLAPQIGRMYLEPYFWMLFMLAVQPNVSIFDRYGWLKWPIFGQGILVMIAALVGAVLLIPGAFLPDWRAHIMTRSANGYEIMQWADTVLPKDAILLNNHRSMALAPRDAVSLSWMDYVDIRSTEAQVYLNKLKLKKVSHILVIGPIDHRAPLSGCFGKVLAGPGIGHLATRNPFNQGPNYEAWIFEFKSAALPECAVKADNGQE
jgi:hypothetical protein